MNRKITTLHLIPGKDITFELNRVFRIFFKPDRNQEHFVVGMTFNIVSVDRVTGEIIFSLDAYRGGIGNEQYD